MRVICRSKLIKSTYHYDLRLVLYRTQCRLRESVVFGKHKEEEALINIVWVIYYLSLKSLSLHEWLPLSIKSRQHALQLDMHLTLWLNAELNIWLENWTKSQFHYYITCRWLIRVRWTLRSWMSRVLSVLCAKSTRLHWRLVVFRLAKTLIDDNSTYPGSLYSVIQTDP